MSKRNAEDLQEMHNVQEEFYVDNAEHDGLHALLVCCYDLGLARGQQEPDAETAALARLGEKALHDWWQNAPDNNRLHRCRFCLHIAPHHSDIVHQPLCPVPPALAAIEARKERDDE